MNVKRVLSVILSICMVLSMLTVGVLASTEQCVEFTVETLGLEHQRYTSSATIVSGVAVEWIQLGNYDNGIQMRDKNGNTSMFWNTEALSGGITKIELTYSTSKDVIYSNPDAVIVKFGNEVKGAAYSTTLSTTAGVMTYTITPDADTYRYFYIEHDLAYTMYWNSIKVYYNGDGSETPDTSDDPDTSIEPELVNGYYEIYTADQLYWFAQRVNSGDTSINGKLMADIVVNENVLTAEGELNGDGSNFRVWTPIGNYDYRYKGIFDGNGKIISGLYFNDTSKSYVGLFGYSSGTVKNVGVVGSYLRGNDYVGGVVGYDYCGIVSNCYNTGSVSGISSVGGVVGLNYEYGDISNCYNAGSVSGSSIFVGGVVGENCGTVSNCYNIGSVSGGKWVGGVVGDNWDTVSNCFNTGSVNGRKYVGGVVGYSRSVSNCYYLIECAKDGGDTVQYGVGNSTQGSTTADVDGKTIGKTSAQFASGEVAYLLNMSGGVRNWGQKLDVDRFPAISQDQVYKDGASYANCPGHVYVDGFCTICDDYEPAVLNGEIYEISNAGQLYWFANSVNTSDYSINGKLIKDIVVNENVLTAEGELNGDGCNFRVWIPIGHNNCWLYTGTFDGNGKIVSGLYVNDVSKSYVGLFGYVDSGGVIKNVGVVCSYLRGSDYVGGVVGYSSGIVSDSYNSGSVSGNSIAGGVVGCNTGTVSTSYNSGSVSGTSYVGGVNGKNGSCYFLEINSGVWIYDYGTISNSYNTGSVSGSISKVGGVVGVNNYGTISNCYNTGAVCGGRDNVGGVIGENSSSGGTVCNCYYLIGCTKDGSNTVQYGVGISTQDSATVDVTGNTIGKTTAQFASGEVCYLLQGEQEEQIWGQTIGTDKYPTLGGATVYMNQARGCTDSAYTYVYANTSVAAVVTHNWEVPTCIEPKTCTDCGLTEGDALGHDWAEATCTEPMICTACGTINGKALGHDFVKNVCIHCGEAAQVPTFRVSGAVTSYLKDGDVTVELLQNGETVYSVSVIGSNVSFVIEGVAAGAYVMRISKENHASREYSITVGSEDVTQDAKICPIGDVTGDGMVNIKDFQRMLRHVNESKLLEGYALLCGDVTGDGDVTIKDFQRLLRHVNESKPLF